MITRTLLSFSKPDTTNLHWLGDGETTQTYYYIRSRRSRLFGFNPLSASINIQLQYFLNSRTKFELYHSTVYSEIKLQKNERQHVYTDSGYVVTIIPYENSYKTFYLNTGFSGTYYFTPRISIIGRITHNMRTKWDMNYSSDHELFDSLNFLRENTKANSLYFSLNVNYYIL